MSFLDGSAAENSSTQKFKWIEENDARRRVTVSDEAVKMAAVITVKSIPGVAGFSAVESELEDDINSEICNVQIVHRAGKYIIKFKLFIYYGENVIKLHQNILKTLSKELMSCFAIELLDINLEVMGVRPAKTKSRKKTGSVKKKTTKKSKGDK